jgi:hypothetical protein
VRAKLAGGYKAGQHNGWQPRVGEIARAEVTLARKLKDSLLFGLQGSR